MRIRKALRTRTGRASLVALALLGGVLGYVLGFWDNFGAVREGEFYRSGQMTASNLSDKVRRYHIKTVINLRGSHPESAEYLAERDSTLSAGASQVDLNLSSCEWMSKAQARALLEVLETAEKPILVHCWHGSERTGLVAAFAELLRPGSTLADAEAQFTADWATAWSPITTFGPTRTG